MVGDRRNEERDEWTFGRLLRWHLDEGTRPDGQRKPWGDPASGYEEFIQKIGGPDAEVDPKKLNYWLQDEHVPMRKTYREKILPALFGVDVSRYADPRRELANAYERSRPKRQKVAAPINTLSQRPKLKQTVISNLPFRSPSHFMGRRETLHEVNDFLSRKQLRPLVLHGLQGSGKTSVAIAYAERHSDDLRATWWIRAQAESTIRTDLVELGNRLGWIKSPWEETQALAAVRLLLEQNGEGVLLIYDNARNDNYLKSHLPRSGAAQILLTSTSGNWRDVADLIEIRVWSEEMGAEFLLERTGFWAQRTHAEALSRRLGGLPLALEQAAATCVETGISLTEYHTRFNQAPAKLLKTGAPREHTDPVYKSFTLAIEEVAKTHPAAEPLFMYVALLAPEPIPLILFIEAAHVFDTRLAASFAREALGKLASKLEDFALIRREDERVADFIQVHPMVHDVVLSCYFDRSDDAELEKKRYELLKRCFISHPEAARAEATSTLIKALNLVYPDDVFDDPTKWARARQVDEHVRILLPMPYSVAPGLEAAVSRLYDRLGSYYHGALAAYDRARPMLQRALAIRENTLDARDELIADSLNNLARLHWDEGNLAEAKNLFERALSLRRNRLGPRHPKTAASLNNLGSLLQVLGDFDAAFSHFELANDIRLEVYGPKHRRTASTLTNLARVLRDQQKYKEGLIYAEQALKIRQKELGSDHPRTAASLNVLANLLHGLGEFSTARENFYKALAVCKNVLGLEHPYTAATLNSIAALDHSEGNLESAKRNYEMALEIREKVLPPGHYSIAASLHGFAALLKEQGDSSSSERHYKRALDIRMKVFGSEHPATVASRLAISHLQAEAGLANPSRRCAKPKLTAAAAKASKPRGRRR